MEKKEGEGVLLCLDHTAGAALAAVAGFALVRRRKRCRAASATAAELSGLEGSGGQHLFWAAALAPRPALLGAACRCRQLARAGSSRFGTPDLQKIFKGSSKNPAPRLPRVQVEETVCDLKCRCSCLGPVPACRGVEDRSRHHPDLPAAGRHRVAAGGGADGAGVQGASGWGAGEALLAVAQALLALPPFLPGKREAA